MRENESMRRIYLTSLCTLFLCAAGASVAHAERILNFDTVGRIQQDSSVIVTERIEYDFEGESRHGIYRDIPVRYKNSYGNFSIRLGNISVTDESGAAYRFGVSRQGADKRIKIGDPDVLITGVHTYVITYTVDRALSFQKSSDQFYWNVTGNGWEVPINAAAAQVVPPVGLAEDAVQIFCYKGVFGSTQACDHSGMTPGGDGLIRNLAFSASQLGPGEGLTFKMDFPKGVVAEPTALQKTWHVVQDNGIVAVPIAAFIIMFWLWYRHGKDPAGRGLIIAEYEPPEHLTPAQVGGLVDQNLQNKDIAAEIIELAVRGYMRIRQEDKKEYIFIQLKPGDQSLSAAQQELLEGLFGGPEASQAIEPGALKQVRLADLKNKFYKTLAKVKASFGSSLVALGYMTARPELIRGGFLVFAGLLTWLGFGILSQTSLLTFISLLATAGCIAGFGWAMPKRTYQGVLVTEKILGFKEYLRVVEKDRLKFHNAPEKKPEIFEKCLPYAMALGVEKEWAAQFADIYTQEPGWYHGSSGAGFNSVIFASSLNSFASQTNSVLASSPSGGSGGGFSGGGGGGGGGGSW